MFKAKDFLSRKPEVITYFKKKGVTEKTVSEYCTLCMIPLTVVYEFIRDEFPEHKELCNRKIQDVNEFVGVSVKKCPFCEEPCTNPECV